MSTRIASLSVLCLAVLTLLARPAALPAADAPKMTGPPTAAEIKKVLYDSYHEDWSKDWGAAKVETLTIEVSEPKVGELIDRQLRRGELAQPCYPVRATVHVKVKYVGNDKVKDFTFNDGKSDAYLFYKNAFGEWTFKTGTV